MKHLLCLLSLLALPASAQTVTGAGPLPKLLYQNSATVGSGADLTEDTLYTTTLPAGILANVGDTLHYTARGLCAGNTDSKSARVKFASLNISNVACTVAGNTSWYTEGYIVKIGPSQQAWMSIYNSASNITISNQSSVATVTDTGTITFSVTGQNTTNPTANSVQVQQIVLYLFPAAS
jgi:hypothetical protein